MSALRLLPVAGLVCGLAVTGCAGGGSQTSTSSGLSAGAKTVHCTRKERVSAEQLGPVLRPHEGLSRVSLRRAEARAPFPVLLPSDPAANRRNMAGPYIAPGRAFRRSAGHLVELEFPIPDPGSCRVTQPHILLLERPWPPPGTTNPRRFFRVGHPRRPNATRYTKHSCYVGGLPGRCIRPHSPKPPSGNSPAGVEFAVGHTTVEIAGGDNLDLLERIGSTLITHQTGASRTASRMVAPGPPPGEPGVPLGSAARAQAEAGFAILKPRYLPAGYRFQGAFVVGGAHGSVSAVHLHFIPASHPLKSSRALILFESRSSKLTRKSLHPNGLEFATKVNDYPALGIRGDVPPTDTGPVSEIQWGTGRRYFDLFGPVHYRTIKRMAGSVPARPGT